MQKSRKAQLRKALKQAVGRPRVSSVFASLLNQLKLRTEVWSASAASCRRRGARRHSPASAQPSPRGPWGWWADRPASRRKTGGFGFLYSGGDFDIAVLKGEFSITKWLALSSAAAAPRHPPPAGLARWCPACSSLEKRARSLAGKPITSNWSANGASNSQSMRNAPCARKTKVSWSR